MSRPITLSAAVAAVLCLLCPVFLIPEEARGYDTATMSAIFAGGEMTEQEAAELEEQLEAEPDDVLMRTKLLGYYFGSGRMDQKGRAARGRHVLWLIEHRPDAPVLTLPYGRLDGFLERDAYDRGRQLWLEHVEQNPEDTSIIGKAAAFVMLHDPGRSEELLKRAQELEPDNPEWPERLAHLYELQTQRASGQQRVGWARKALEQFDLVLNLQDDERHRFYMLSRVARMALSADETEKAKQYAQELLDLAPAYRRDWNYGNAIHHGNIVLGRIALQQEDVEGAKEQLIAAGRTPGSPQLNSFGPDMLLAKQLLEKGEREVVLEYLELCSEFWALGQDELEQWKADVAEGRRPDFGRHVER